MNLFIVTKLLGYIASADRGWTLRQFLGMMAFVGVTSGLLHLIIRFIGYFFTSDRFYL